MTEAREIVARALAANDGFDPDEEWEEFDRSSAATVTMVGEYEGWETDVFPPKVRWREYESQAEVAIAAHKASLREAGLAIVPVEATEEMLRAANDAILNCEHIKAARGGVARAYWTAMLLSSQPAPPAPDQGSV